MIGALARLLAILLAIGLCLGVALVVYTALDGGLSAIRLDPEALSGPVSDQPERVRFTVQPGQSASSVGEELQRQGLIRSSLAFRWEIEKRRLSNRLEAGEYELSPSMSTTEIVAVLAKGAMVRGTSVTNLEGWRADQLAQRLEELQLARSGDILRIVHSPRDYGLTPPDPAAESLEGFLFPDTYEFGQDATPTAIVQKMLRQFEQSFDPDLRQRAAASRLSLRQVVTLASIIEREAALPSERPLISAVYRNRLAAGMKLDADPTVQFAVASANLQEAVRYGFWKRELSLEDLDIVSPYNTYRLTGLPPGPICNPGLASLQAAVAPADAPYLYFVARGDGSHAFATTLAEHNANITKFR